jgi:hypothetical protein
MEHGFVGAASVCSHTLSIFDGFLVAIAVACGIWIVRLADYAVGVGRSYSEARNTAIQMRKIASEAGVRPEDIRTIAQAVRSVRTIYRMVVSMRNAGEPDSPNSDLEDDSTE